MSRWVNYEGELALLVAYDESTDLCEIHRLTRFVLDDGDEDYFPTAEDSGSEISDVSLDDECSSAAESPKRESDVQITENTE